MEDEVAERTKEAHTAADVGEDGVVSFQACVVRSAMRVKSRQLIEGGTNSRERGTEGRRRIEEAEQSEIKQRGGRIRARRDTEGEIDPASGSYTCTLVYRCRKSDKICEEAGETKRRIEKDIKVCG